MFYVVFFISNYISLGIGSWIAIRHGEIARNQLMQGKIHQPEIILDSKITQTASKSHQNQISENPFDKTPETGTPEAEENGFDNHINVEEAMRNVDGKLPRPHTQEWQADAVFVNELPSTPTPLPLPSGEMIERLVGMIEEEGSGELTSLASHLQEIHDMLTPADKRYYASEDAEFFVTPNEQKYASIAICRPIVGRKS